MTEAQHILVIIPMGKAPVTPALLTSNAVDAVAVSRSAHIVGKIARVVGPTGALKDRFTDNHRLQYVRRNHTLHSDTTPEMAVNIDGYNRNVANPLLYAQLSRAVCMGLC